MTTKDYEVLAAAFAKTRPPRRYDSLFIVWHRTRTAVADALAADNERFDKALFYKATERSTL